jgi:hypothetical protein
MNGPKVNYGVPEDVLAVLKLSYDKPTPVQMQTLPLMLDRRETLVCAPTGSGKKKFILGTYLKREMAVFMFRLFSELF